MKTILIAVATIALVGCASVVNDSTHPMKIETKTLDGRSVKGARCILSNDYGKVDFLSGDTLQVRRSSKDLDITCKYPSEPDANAHIISRVNGGMMGNILLGGGIGAIIDHNKGTAYTYPTWVQLIFGKTLVFDRSDEKEGHPVCGREPAA
jgi:hypothetical protein